MFSEKAMKLLVLSSNLILKMYTTYLALITFFVLYERFYLQNIPTSGFRILVLVVKMLTPNYLIDELICLLLIQVSTTTPRRIFSTMNIVKIRLRSKMRDKFLATSLIIYIEKQIANTFST